MYDWKKQIQEIVDEIDRCIKNHTDEALTLRCLAGKLGYSEFYTTRKFKEMSGMQLRDYLRRRKLAFALKEVRDTGRGILDIALDHGFSSHEAFTRAFKGAMASRRANTGKIRGRSYFAPKSTRLTVIFLDWGRLV